MVFVASLKAQDEFKATAEQLLRRVHEGRVHACASVVTLMEVAYVVRRGGGTGEQVNDAVHACLSIKHLEFLPLTPDLMRQASDCLLAYRLDLSDAIIAATMAQEGIDAIASEDRDFDSVPFVKRISLSHL